MNLFNDPVNHMKNMLLYGKVSSNHTVPQLNILGLDRNTSCMESTCVHIFEHVDKKGFRGLLKSEDGGALKPKGGVKVLGDLSHQTLKRKFSNQKVCGFLVLADLS